MRLLQSGMAKSGNYWLYKIIQNIFEQAHIPKQNYIKEQAIYPIAKNWELSFPEQVEINVLDIAKQGYFYRISSVFKYPISDIEEYVNKNTHIWTHSNYCSKTEQVLKYFDKVIYIIRDPRDVMISTAKFRQTPYMKKFFPSEEGIDELIDKNYLLFIKQWANHVLGYWNNFSATDIYFVFYEQLLTDFDNELKRLLNYCSIKLNSNQIDKIKNTVSFSSMKTASPNHVRRAKLYNWKEVLTDKQKEAIIDNYGHILKAFNYPLSDSEDNLPYLPNNTIALNGGYKKEQSNLSIRERLRLIKKALSF